MGLLSHPEKVSSTSTLRQNFSLWKTDFFFLFQDLPFKVRWLVSVLLSSLVLNYSFN